MLVWVSVASYLWLCFSFLVFGVHSTNPHVTATTTPPHLPITNTDHLATVAPQLAHTQTLIHVHAIWRHGDRTPSTLLASDTDNNAASWDNALGELTNEGIAQQYRLGKWLRNRYNSFLGERYSPSEVYIRSSDFNRTLMSAEANLAALFPPHNQQSWTNELRWQPIPVHTVAKERDPELYESINCPEANREVQRVFNENEEAIRFEKENAAMLEYIGRNAGWSESAFRLSNMWFVFDPLNVVLNHNKTHKMPKWVNWTIWNEIVRLYDISCQFYFFSEKVKRLRGGMLIKEIMERMNRKAEDPVNFREKFHAYSAHDMTIASILSVVGVRPSTFPLYASLVLFELHNNNNDTFTIKLFYKNVTDSPTLYEYPIESCGKPCKLQTFIARSLKYIPEDWKRECGYSTCYSTTISFYIGVILLLSSTTILLGSIVVYDLVKKCVGRYRRYEGRIRLPTSDYCNDNLT